MQPTGRLALGVLAVAAGSLAALAQSAVISARSGLIHYVEGQVYLGDQLVDTKFGVFPEVKENQQLKTEEGRAEVLLTPGVFLRVGESSSIRMITNRLIDTRLEFLQGAVVVDADDIAKDNSVTVVYGEAAVHPTKKGVYRFDSESGELRVYDGLAEVTRGDQTVEVREGHLIALDTLAVHKFDKTVTDALNRWSERRDQYVSMANVGAANTLRTSPLYTAAFNTSFTGGWYWNPYFGMYSYVPGMGGMFYSPFGYPFFSPFDVYMAFMPGFYYYPNYFGNYGYWGGYGNPYNSIGYKTVPVPSHPTGSSGSGTVASGHSPSVGSSGTSSSGTLPVTSLNPGSSVGVAHSGSAGSSSGGHH